MKRLALTMAIVGVLALAGGTAFAKDRGRHQRGPARTARKYDRHYAQHYRSHPYHPRSRYYGPRVVVPYSAYRPVVVPYWQRPSVVYTPSYYGPQSGFYYRGRGFGISIGF